MKIVGFDIFGLKDPKRAWGPRVVQIKKKSLLILFEKMGCSFIWAMNHRISLSKYKVIRMAQKTQKGPWGRRVIQIKKKSLHIIWGNWLLFHLSYES